MTHTPKPTLFVDPSYKLDSIARTVIAKPITAAKFTILGLSDEVTTCGCCGRINLKRTVAMSRLDADGNDTATEYYGTTCAETATGLSHAAVSRAVTESCAENARLLHLMELYAGLVIADASTVNGWFNRRNCHLSTGDPRRALRRLADRRSALLRWALLLLTGGLEALGADPTN